MDDYSFGAYDPYAGASLYGQPDYFDSYNFGQGYSYLDDYSFSHVDLAPSWSSYPAATSYDPVANSYYGVSYFSPIGLGGSLTATPNDYYIGVGVGTPGASFYGGASNDAANFLGGYSYGFTTFTTSFGFTPDLGAYGGGFNLGTPGFSYTYGFSGSQISYGFNELFGIQPAY